MKMQKTKRFRLLTVLLAAVMMFTLSEQVYAATSSPVTKDGLTATLVTDKDSYKADESINATVHVDNNTGKQVFIWTQITVPSAAKLAGESAFDAVLANGESWTSAAGIVADGTAGSTATGDNMQAGLWTVLSILAIGGVVALLVYGKNRKTWLSIMLCVVMISGLMAAAVPAQAAGVSGSMSLSCPIQLDGKAAEVTAIVNYIIGYEASSSTATTPGETPTTAPTEVPTEAPTETPTETPTEAPTEAPTAAPTEAPVEDKAASENGYYLVWDDFNMVSANSYSVQGFSSWDVSTPTSVVTKADGVCYTDASIYSDAQILRQFNEVSDDFTWEFTVKLNGDLNGTIIDMRYQDETAIRFVKNGTALEAVTPEGNVTICEELLTESYTALKLHISPSDGTYSVFANGQKIAEELAFLNECEALDRIFVQTTEEGTGSIYFGTVRIYTGYYVNEKFLDAGQGTVSDEWTQSGNVVGEYKQGTQGPDNYSASLSDGASLSREVSYKEDGAWVEYQLLIPENMDEFSMILEDNDGNAFRVSVISTGDGENAFGYYDENGDFVSLYDEYQNNLWYHIMLKQTDEGGMLYLNHKLKAEEIKLPFAKFTKMSFVAGNGQAYLDDVVLKDWIPYPEDYVKAPQAVEEDGYLVGIQSCSLWVEGQHFGYDWLSSWEERTPYLGYYDELLPETADWELLWKVEHGIDFELFCWFRPWDGNDEPIKMGRNAMALHEGYFNAKYSDMMQFAITWESAGSYVSGSEDFRENVVPYWIEQYFKDDRYLKIDNKPVVGMMNLNLLMGYFGGASGVKNEMDYLRQACVDAGFDGCIIMLCNTSSAESMQIDVEAAGFDAQYPYTWGYGSYDLDIQKNGLLALEESVGDGNADVVATVSMGFDDSAWDRKEGAYCTTENFQKMLEWTKNEFMASKDAEDLGAKMIMLDNWNELAEGHFIMPTNLAGFEYLDAVRTVFGDGSSHTDVIPTDSQRERINHMYIQDRVVSKTASYTYEMEAVQGFYFEEEGNVEGWTVADYKGQLLDVENLRQEDGAMKGNTYLGDASYADPAMFSPNLKVDAQEVTQIRVRMRTSNGADTPFMYFITENDTAWTQAKSVETTYSKDVNGEYVDLIFNMSDNTAWAGVVTQIRLDPITVAGSFEIDSVELLRRKETEGIQLYVNGNKIYNNKPIKMVNGVVMVATEDVELLNNLAWSKRLDGSAIEVFVDEQTFYRFPFGSNTMIVEGQTVRLTQGATIIDGLDYLPIGALYESEGYIVEWNEEDMILYISRDKSDDPYTVVKGYYFESDVEGWLAGGSANTITWQKGVLFGVAGDDEVRCWSPETSMGVRTANVSHIRIRIKSTVEDSELKVVCRMDGNASKEAVFTAEYGQENGYTELLIDCSENSVWNNSSIVDRIGVYAFNGNIGESFKIDYIELVTDGEILPEPDPNVLLGYYFSRDAEGWLADDATELVHENGALIVPAASESSNNSPVVWSTTVDSDGVYEDPINILAKNLESIRVRIKTDAESAILDEADLRLVCEFTDTNQTVYLENYDTTYTVHSDDYVEVTVNFSKELKDSLVLKRIGIMPFGESGNQTLAEAGVKAFIDSVEILKDPNTVIGNDDGLNEVADSSYKVLFGSNYFKDGDGNWGQGGTTGLTASGGALKVTAASDGRPRIWSSYETEGVCNDPLNISAADLTHIRIRIKSDVADQKMVLECRFRDEDGKEHIINYKNLTYETGTGTYAEVLVDCRDVDDSYTLERIAIHPFGMTDNETLAGQEVYIGSVEYLQKKTSETAEEPLKVLVLGNSITQHGPSAEKGWLANWGMAATCPENDYVHLLQDKVLEKNASVEMHWGNIAEYEKYFYDWSKIDGDYSKYVDFDADIIICTIGANITNGQWEEDSSYENGNTFTKEHYKAILDYFNPGSDATIITGTFISTKTEVVNAIVQASEAYGYEYVDMTDWQYDAHSYEDELKAALGVDYISEGVLGHPGDADMQKIADRLWEKLDLLIEKGESTEGSSEDAYTVLTDRSFYFREGAEGWSHGGTTGLARGESCLVLTAPTAAGDYSPRIWSPVYNPNVASGEATHIRVRIRTDATDTSLPNPTLYLYFDFLDADNASQSGSVTAEYAAVSEDYIDVVFDLTEIWKEGYSMTRMGLRPFGLEGNQALAEAGVKGYVDSVELLKAN